MDANGLLTVLAILLAGYTLLSNERRLDIKIRMSWLDYSVLIFFSLVILAVIYSPVIITNLSIEPIKWHFGFDKETWIFTCLLIIIIYSGIKITSGKISAAKYKDWKLISEQLLREKKFFELAYLLNKYHVQLFGIIHNKVWYVSLHNHIRPKPLVSLEINPETNFFAPFIYGARIWLAKIFPNKSKNQDIVRLSISRILKSKAFVIYLTETYSSVAAKATDFLNWNEFSNYFFETLISSPNSPLYRELRDNQSCSYTGEYELDDSNQLLNFYFKDIEVAVRSMIWKPTGDYIVEYIKKQRGKNNFYNQPLGTFSEGDECWLSPIFMGATFFKIMVSSAIFQRKNYHMSLMYFERFTEEILICLDRYSNENLNSEFPCKFDYLLYELFSGCDRWVGTLEYLNFENVSEDKSTQFPEYWAAETLGSMLQQLIMSEKLSDNQKVYFLEIAVKRTQILQQQNFALYAQLIFDKCVESDPKIKAELTRVYKQMDPALNFAPSIFKTKITSPLATTD